MAKNLKIRVDSRYNGTAGIREKYRYIQINDICSMNFVYLVMAGILKQPRYK